MQYLVLLPGLPSGHRGELFIQFRVHVPYKDRARAEPYAKRYPNDTIFSNSARVTGWSHKRPNRWGILVVVCYNDGLNFCVPAE